MFVEGNLIMASHKQDAKSNNYTLFFNNNSPLEDSKKRPLHFGFQNVLLGLSSIGNV
jgi:hypothetical protein